MARRPERDFHPLAGSCSRALVTAGVQRADDDLLALRPDRDGAVCRVLRLLVRIVRKAQYKNSVRTGQRRRSERR